MIDPQTRQTIEEMHKRGVSIRKISSILNIDRKTVRKIIQGNHPGQSLKSSQYARHLPVVKELYTRCRGNVVRVQEILCEEHDISIPYATLTWLVREEGLRQPRKKQAGSYTFEPGEEMQHDTSPYRLALGKNKTSVQCASLVLAYSRKLYIQFYPRFTRFEARCFLTQAFTFMEGTCNRCTIDNTSVLLAHGTGPDAEMAPEIKLLENIFSTKFKAHNVGHSDRKARIERPFGYIEGNFLAGRTFAGWQDLNAQALGWCETVANQKIKRILGMSPDQAYLMEKPFLNPLPAYIPPVYETVYRVVDIEGYVNLDTNRYSVPYKLIGSKIEVQKHLDKVMVYFRRQEVAQHKRELEKKRTRVTNPAHRAPYLRQKAYSGPCKEERMLKGENEILDKYVAELKKRSHGRGVAKFRKLLEVKRTYPKDAFLAGISKAFQYGLYDLKRLESIILSYVAGNFFEL